MHWDGCSLVLSQDPLSANIPARPGSLGFLGFTEHCSRAVYPPPEHGFELNLPVSLALDVIIYSLSLTDPILYYGCRLQITGRLDVTIWERTRFLAQATPRSMTSGLSVSLGWQWSASRSPQMGYCLFT